MKEKIKSLILFFLVFSSLVLTWILIYFIPNNGNVPVSEYLPRYRFGQELSIERLMGAREIVLHFGENHHTVLYSDSVLFQSFVRELKKGTFYDFSLVQNDLDWKNIVENQKGIELHFSGSIPLEILKGMLLITPNEHVPSQVNRIWITNNMQQLSVYFFNDLEGKIYTAKTSISNTMIENFLALSMKLPSYSYFTNQSPAVLRQLNFSYLPDTEVSVPIFKGTLLEVPNDNLIQLLFLDPTAVRKVDDGIDGQRDIFTDGSKSLQVYSDEHYLNYYQPVVQYQQMMDVEESLKAAIYYVNQQGGWGGDYSLSFIRGLNDQSWEFAFHQYVQGLPILERESLQVRLQVKNGTVSFYQRPIQKIIQGGETSTVTLKNRPLIIEDLKKEGIKESDIQSMTLTYQMVEQKQDVLFYPYWKILLTGQRQIEVPAY